MKSYSGFKKFRNFLLATTSVFALAGEAPVVTSAPQQAPIPLENDSVPQLVVNNPVQTVTFRNDTLYRGSATLLYYLKDNITRNVMDKRQSYRMQLPYFAHENKHDQNEKVKTASGVHSYRIGFKYSPSQYATLCMFDEVTANLVAIETAAFEYITASDKKAVTKKYENTYMKFYFDAIKDGRIEPLKLQDINYIKAYRYKLEEYRSFVANETQNMWDKTFRKQYSPAQYNMVLRYITNVGLYQPFNGSFNYVADHMWTIGGVNFFPYLDHIIEPYDTRIKLFDDMAYVSSLTKDKKSTSAIVNDISDNFKYLSDFSHQQQNLAFQHLFIAAKMKSELQNFDKNKLIYNPQYVAMAYRKTMYELAHDLSFYTFVEKDAFIGKPIEFNSSLLSREQYASLSIKDGVTIDADTEAKLKRFYRFKGLDLTMMVPHFKADALPVSPTSFLETELNKFFNLNVASYSFDEEIQQIIALQNQEELELSAVISENTMAESIKPRRLSENMYMKILDFREPLLEPEAMNEEAMDKIAQLFREFDSIPQVFKNCDFSAKAQYEKEHGVTYFTKPDAPFQPAHSPKPKTTAKGIFNLAQIRPSHQQK